MKKIVIVFMAVMALMIVSSAGAEEFNHTEHLTYLDGDDCQSCHVEGAEDIVPEKESCLNCHDSDFIEAVKFPGLKSHDLTWALNHRSAAKSGSMDCAACHQQSECLECHAAGFADEMGALGNTMTNVHRGDFSVSHPISARSNPQLCASCHENRFCVECHDQFNPNDLALDSHRRSFSSITIGNSGPDHEQFSDDMCQTCHTDSVLPSHEWSNSHAREARKNLATCQACHPEGQVCLKCHSAVSGLGVNPHPKDWDDFEGRMRRASNGRTCRQCH